MADYKVLPGCFCLLSHYLYLVIHVHRGTAEPNRCSGGLFLIPLMNYLYLNYPKWRNCVRMRQIKRNSWYSKHTLLYTGWYGDLKPYLSWMTSSQTWSGFIWRMKNDFAVPFLLFLVFKNISLFHFLCQSSFNVHLEKRKIDFTNSRKANDNAVKVKNTIAVYAMDFVWALFVWTLYMDFVCDLYIYFEWSLFSFFEGR